MKRTTGSSRLGLGFAFFCAGATILLALACEDVVCAELSVTRFLPEGHVTDGSESYHQEIQNAIDAAASSGQTLRFPAAIYAVGNQPWQLRTNLTIDLRGATLRISETCRSDSTVFRGHDIHDVTLLGGRIVGRNDVWGDGVNIRGVHITGRSSRLRFQQTRFEDLSSNAIGLFGSEERSIRDVWVQDVIAENCCKRYADYLSGEKSEAGSVREDQGDVAFYFVEDFVVSGCRFERSRSDGTHFYRCKNGQISDNHIYRSKMGGYFLEQCDSVVGHGNVIVDNGSRGTTIERGSTNCVFSNNIVRGSGREGLWAPDCVGLVVTGNVFDRNGRKPNGPQPRFIWNANITINDAFKDPSNSPTQDYLISDNLVRTTADQIAAIRVVAAEDTRDIVIRNNHLIGVNRKILVAGPDRSHVRLSGNGWSNDASDAPHGKEAGL